MEMTNHDVVRLQLECTVPSLCLHRHSTSANGQMRISLVAEREKAESVKVGLTVFERPPSSLKIFTFVIRPEVAAG